MADCCLIKKVATVEVYENKNEVRAYGFMAGDRNTPVMEVRFKHLWGESNLSTCKLRWIIVDDVGSLLVGEVPIQSDNTALINLPNELFTGERRMKVQLTVASCDGGRILNLQQFTDLKVINNLATNEVVEPVYNILINALYDESQKHLAELETSYTNKFGSLEGLYLSARSSLENYLVNAENGGNAEFVQGYAPFNFNRVENTMAELQASSKYKLGDVVEVLGYYEKGDGADHKRIISPIDDGSGILLANGLYANIIISNNVFNLKWLGCRNDDELSQYFVKVQKIQKLFSDSWLGYTIEIPRGNYTFAVPVIWEQTRVINIQGEGSEQSVFIDFRNLPINSYAFHFKATLPINYRLPHFTIKNIVVNGFDCNAGFVKAERSVFSVFENIWLQGFKPVISKVFSLTNDTHFFKFSRVKVLGCNNVFEFNTSEGHKINNCWFDNCDGIDFRGTSSTTVENTDFETGNKNFYTGDRNFFRIHFERNGTANGLNNGETLINVGNDTELNFKCSLDGGTQHYPFKFLGEGSKVKLSGTSIDFVESTMNTWSTTNLLELGELILFSNSLKEITFNNIKTKRNKTIVEGNSTNMIVSGNVTVEHNTILRGMKGITITNTSGSNQDIQIELTIPTCESVAFSKIYYTNISGSSIKTITLYQGVRTVTKTNEIFKEYKIAICNSLSFGEVKKIVFSENLPNGNVRFIKYPIISQDMELVNNFNEEII